VQDVEPTFLVFPHEKTQLKKTYFYVSPYAPAKSTIATHYVRIVSLILAVSLLVCTPISGRIIEDTGASTRYRILAMLLISILQSSTSYNHSVYTQLAYTISPPNEVAIQTSSRSLLLDSSYLPLRTISLNSIYAHLTSLR
jgi:hypothetical protein